MGIGSKNHCIFSDVCAREFTSFSFSGLSLELPFSLFSHIHICLLPPLFPLTPHLLVSVFAPLFFLFFFLFKVTELTKHTRLRFISRTSFFTFLFILFYAFIEVSASITTIYLLFLIFDF